MTNDQNNLQSSFFKRAKGNDNYLFNPVTRIHQIEHFLEASPYLLPLHQKAILKLSSKLQANPTWLIRALLSRGNYFKN